MVENKQKTLKNSKFNNNSNYSSNRAGSFNNTGFRQNKKEKDINDKTSIKLDGVVKEIFPGQKFLIEFQNGHRSTGSLSGKLMVNSIMLEKGDIVACEIPVDNLNICRIVYRKKSRR